MGLAYLSWKYIEKPFRDKRTFGRRTIFTYGAIGTAAFIAMGVAGTMGNGFDHRLNAQALRLYRPATSRTVKGTANCDRGGSAYPELESSCILGDQRNVVGVLVGDSHANALAYALGQEARRAGIGIVQMTFLGCPPAGSVYRTDMTVDDLCAQLNREVERDITSK